MSWPSRREAVGQLRVVKTISRVAVVVFGLMAIGFLSRCGGGQSALQQPPPPLVITTASLPNGTAETAYSQTMQASGGVAPYTWTVTASTLPHNLALTTSATDSATLAGTPDVPAQALAFTIKVTDSATHSATQPTQSRSCPNQTSCLFGWSRDNFWTERNSLGHES